MNFATAASREKSIHGATDRAKHELYRTLAYILHKTLVSDTALYARTRRGPPGTIDQIR